MKVIKGFANYGVLAHEKETIFTIEGENTHATVSEKIEIIIPDEYEVSENNYGNILIDIPGGRTYMARDIILSRESEPVLEWYDGKEHSIKLDWRVL